MASGEREVEKFRREHQIVHHKRLCRAAAGAEFVCRADVNKKQVALPRGRGLVLHNVRCRAGEDVDDLNILMPVGNAHKIREIRGHLHMKMLPGLKKLLCGHDRHIHARALLFGVSAFDYTERR